MLKQPNSYHHRNVMIVPLRGEATVVVNGYEFPIKPGRVLLISHYQFHRYTNVRVDENEWLFLMFEGDSQFKEFARIACVPLTHQFWDDLRVLVETYLKPATEQTARQLVLRVMLLLALFGEQKPLKFNQSQQTGEVCDLLMRAYDLITKNMDKNLTASDISAMLGVSESHLRNKFRAVSGCSIGSYMRNIRLYRATNLLLSQKMNVSEVAVACGWESAFSFSRAFSAHWGMSPRDYIKKMST